MIRSVVFEMNFPFFVCFGWIWIGEFYINVWGFFRPRINLHWIRQMRRNRREKSSNLQ